jgi:steroid Delta-isomerase
MTSMPPHPADALKDAEDQRHADPHAARLIAFFEAMTPADLDPDRLGRVYHPNARFQDPFNTVQGLAAVRQVYAHMFESLHQPRFEVREALVQGNAGMLVWDFVFSRRGQPTKAWRIHGATRLQWDAQGRITDHRDYWDAAGELYEKLPVLGAVLRTLRRRLAAAPPPSG